jgi:hypothetical protein
MAIDTSKTEQQLQQYPARIRAAMVMSLRFTGKWAAGFIRANYLQGQVLGVKNGRESGTTNYQLDPNSNPLILYVGTNARADKTKKYPEGFNYPAYWELYARRVPPRPVFGRFVREHQQQIREMYVNKLRELIYNKA